MPTSGTVRGHLDPYTSPTGGTSVRATEILMEEHRVIEQVLDAMDTALGRLGTADAVGAAFFLAVAGGGGGGPPAPPADVVDNGQAYVELLRQHIAKEDNILFPMAAQFLPP